MCVDKRQTCVMREAGVDIHHAVILMRREGHHRSVELQRILLCIGVDVETCAVQLHREEEVKQLAVVTRSKSDITHLGTTRQKSRHACFDIPYSIWFVDDTFYHRVFGQHKRQL